MTHRNMARRQPIEQAIDATPERVRSEPMTEEELHRIRDIVDNSSDTAEPAPVVDRSTALGTEVEALHAIAGAIGALPVESVQRVADWTVAIARDRQRPEESDRLPILKSMLQMVQAVEQHQQANEDPSRADAELYMAVLGQLGHHRMSRKALSVYYRDA